MHLLEYKAWQAQQRAEELLFNSENVSAKDRIRARALARKAAAAAAAARAEVEAEREAASAGIASPSKQLSASAIAEFIGEAGDKERARQRKLHEHLFGRGDGRE